MAFDYDKWIRPGKLPHIWCPGCGHGIVCAGAAAVAGQSRFNGVVDFGRACAGTPGAGCGIAGAARERGERQGAILERAWPAAGKNADHRFRPLAIPAIWSAAWMTCALAA